MYNSFISIVGVLQADYQLKHLVAYLKATHEQLSSSFSDFEIILINNHLNEQPDHYINELPAEVRKDVFLLNLSANTLKNHAILAGLDRANGDYAIVFDLELYAQPHLISTLFEKSRSGYDIVYLRSATRKLPWHIRRFNKLFYQIMRRFSALTIDEGAYDTRIISRRALNSLLKMRENLRYMKAIYSIVGFPTTAITLDKAMEEPEKRSFQERFKTSLIAIASFTTFLRSLLLGIFILAFVFMLGIVANALLVKFAGYDIFGNPGEAVPGWTFLVILISIFFAANFLILYIMSIYLSNIYQEIKQRPLYIIESIRRF